MKIRFLFLIFLLLPLQAWAATASLEVRANGADRPVLLLGMDENQGTSVADSSGSGNTGTFAGTGNTWVQGKFGSAVRMNGNGWISVPHSNSLDVSTFTMEAWVFPTSGLNNFRALFATDPNLGSYVYFFETTAGALCNSDGAPGGGFYDVSAATHKATCDTTPLPLNAWHHVAITYDGAMIRYFRDGQQIGTGVATTYLPLENSGPRYIGSSIFAEGFVGILDEFRMYVNARTQAEIQSDMNTAITIPQPGSPTNLVIGSQPVTIGSQPLSIGY